MKVILLEDVKGLGKKYDVKEISPGYVRNFLLPKNLVEVGTKESLDKLKKLKADLEKKKNILKAELERRAKLVSELKLEFLLKTGPKGEVFGSVTAKEIETLLEKKGFGGLKVINESPIKKLGEHKIEINLGESVRASLNVTLRSQP